MAEQKRAKRKLGEKHSHNKKAKQEKESHISIIITIVLAIVALVIQHYYWRSQVRQYKEQQAPELDCYYEYFATDDVCKFQLKNVGLVDCENIWVEERLFVIVDGEVYEGDDVPHFNYLVFDDSRTRMWDIPKDSEQLIELQELQHRAITRLREKFKAEIISKWEMSFSSESSSKKYYFEKYFIHAVDDRMPQELESYIGGVSILNSIKDYLALGNKQSIKIFDLTMDFELDTPTNYLIDKDYSIFPLSPWTILSIEDFDNSLHFYAEGEPQPADDAKGTIWLGWKYEDGKWGKWTIVGPKSLVYTKPIRMEIYYLSKEDAERVRRDPKLISAGRQRETKKEIREKALAKFLRGQQVD